MHLSQAVAVIVHLNCYISCPGYITCFHFIEQTLAFTPHGPSITQAGSVFCSSGYLQKKKVGSQITKHRVLGRTPPPQLIIKKTPSYWEYNAHFCFVSIRESPIKEDFCRYCKSPSGEWPENYFAWWWLNSNARGCLRISASDLTTVDNSSCEKAHQWFCGRH